MKITRVQFEIAHDRLPMILSVLAGEVQNIATRDMADVIAARQARTTPAAPPASPPDQKPRNGRLMRIALKALKDTSAKVGDAVSYDVIADALEVATFSRTSHPAAITDLVQAGIAIRIGRGKFRIISDPSVLV